MLMLEQRLQQQFFECADLQYQAAESLGRPLSDALQALHAGITGGGRVLVVGLGPAAVLAPYFADLLVGGFERERPPLAALALADERAAPQIQALGQPGDVLLLVDGAPDAVSAAPVVAAAHDKDMSVVALSGASPAWRDALTETDVLVAATAERAPRRLEMQLLMLHALADALDLQLMGEQDSE